MAFLIVFDIGPHPKMLKFCCQLASERLITGFGFGLGGAGMLA
ncbi:MAG: hypothetical protein ACJAWC_003090 [Yoonia sp.]|jgi:hypothetical protein